MFRYNKNMASDEVLKSEDKLILQQVKDEITDSMEQIKLRVTQEGLVPNYNARGRYEKVGDVEGFGYNSELLGYSMRLAVENDDSELFSRLYKGYQFLKDKGPNGLMAARLNVEKELNITEGLSWADGNQDVALALIEAGRKWNETYKAEGVSLAEAFLNSGHVEVVNGRPCVFNSFVEDQSRSVGDHLRFVDLSMWNFRLYEVMEQIRPNDVRWEELKLSGLKILGETLGKFKLPPNRVPLIDGAVVSYSELNKRLEDSDIHASGLGLKMPEAEVLKKTANPQGDYQVCGWDAARIPFRLTDAEGDEFAGAAKILYERLDEVGVLGVNIHAETGYSEGAEVFSPTIAPSLLARIYVEEDLSPAVNNLEKSIRKEREVENSGGFEPPYSGYPLYWKIWDGLAFTQLYGVLQGSR